MHQPWLTFSERGREQNGYFWRRQTLKSNIVNPIQRMQKPCGLSTPRADRTGCNGINELGRRLVPTLLAHLRNEQETKVFRSPGAERRLRTCSVQDLV